MSGDALWDIQKGIYSALTAVSPAIAGGRVFDHAPQTVVFPWVEIGESIAEETDVDGADGTSETVTLHVWSRESGQSEAKQIMSEIKAALHKQSLTVSGRTALAWWGGSLTRKDPDGITHHGIIRINVIARV